MEKKVLGMEQAPHVLNWQVQTISLDPVLYLGTLLKPAFNYVDVETLFHFEWESWSIDYGRRFIFRRLWVRISALYIRMTFFTLINDQK